MNDLLRDKLHYQSSQLAETRDCIRELKNAKKEPLSEILAILGGTSSAGAGDTTGGGLGKVSQHVNHCRSLTRVDLAEKIQALVKRLVEHNHQTVKGQADAAASEARCEILMRQFVLFVVRISC